MDARRLVTLAAVALTVASCGGGTPRASSSADESGGTGGSDAPTTGAMSTGDADPRDTLPITITATVDGKEYTASGKGACNHITDASIYDAPAAQWAYRYTAPNDASGLSSLNLTVWEIKAGGVQLSLQLGAGGKDRRMSTVKGGTIDGQGTARVSPSGRGGTLEVEGAAADGARITLTARCERTVEPVAEGG